MAVEASGRIELVETMGAQDASEGTIAEFNAVMGRQPLERVANDIVINSWLYRNRWLTIEEQAASLSKDLRLASRLGFPSCASSSTSASVASAAPRSPRASSAPEV